MRRFSAERVFILNYLSDFRFIFAGLIDIFRFGVFKVGYVVIGACNMQISDFAADEF